MKLLSRTALGLLGAVLLAAPPAVGAAEEAPPPAPPANAEPVGNEGAGNEGAGNEAAGSEPAVGADLEAYWARRLANASQRISLARERLEKATAEYSRARHDRNPRGGAKAEIEHERVAAEREFEAAEAALPRLVEQARRAGVSPGVLRDYWDEDGEAG